MYNLIFKNVIENTYESAKRWLLLYEDEQIFTDCSTGDALGNNIIYSLLLPKCPILLIYYIYLR